MVNVDKLHTGEIGFIITGMKTIHDCKVGDTIVARKGAVTYTYKVLQLIDKRQGAKLVPQYAENLTPMEELDKLRAPVETFFLKRDRGAGRPTKKDRRQMEDLWSNLSFDVPDDIAERLASDFGLDGDFDSDSYDDDDL